MVSRQNIIRVADLIDSATRSWRTELILNTFSEDDVQNILQIPLAHFPHDDFLMDVESLSTPFGLSGLLEINGFMKDIRDLEQRQRIEAVACLQVVTVGRYLGMKYVEIEGDSLTSIGDGDEAHTETESSSGYVEYEKILN
ncbi:hypothetical protein Gotri_000189 [Gossypium trilobum]|uniref:RNase H type-1 domain-containing protein n=1 Tax=Gossypium trilobum TaxID=34281 RepID=A0A7J9FVE0_9ROSI|nr:hypothetical protein [Gossypium trilobum]